MKEVLLGNEKYIYQKDENGEEILTKDVIIRGKKMQIVLKGDKSRRFRWGGKIYYWSIKWLIYKKNIKRINVETIYY